MSGATEYDVIVIGGGVIGVSAALALQRAGRRVTIIDRERIGAGASPGNAGAFALNDMIPLATPGVIRAAPKWLMDPLGPFAIAPAYLPKIAPWLLRFWRSSWRDRFPTLMAAQASLMVHCRGALERQVAEVDGETLLLRRGMLAVYETERAFRGSLALWEASRPYGVSFDTAVSAGEIAEIQPGLSPVFTRGIYTPDWLNTRDPALWLARLAEVFRGRGGEVEKAAAVALEASPDRVTIRCEGRSLVARHVVLAAGAWSGRLARTLGDRIPLDTERGYNVTLPVDDFGLKTALTFSDHGFVAGPLGDGLRIGGAVEFAGLDHEPNMKRAQALLDKARRFMPGLGGEGGRQWMGFRPSIPDSQPVIGRATRSPRVVYAFGHGHLGLTQSAGTAELVRALVTGEDPPIDLAPFSPDRFRGFW